MPFSSQVDQIPVSNLVGPGVKVDMAPKVSNVVNVNHKMLISYPNPLPLTFEINYYSKCTKDHGDWWIFKGNPCINKVSKDGLDSLLQLEDLESWENQYGRIPNGAVVIVHTGHGR